MHVFTVFDSKAEAFLPPFFARARGAGIRMFSEACRTPDHGFFAHAGDYTLFELGVWDDSSGNFTLHDAKVNLGNGLTFQLPEVK